MAEKLQRSGQPVKPIFIAIVLLIGGFVHCPLAATPSAVQIYDPICAAMTELLPMDDFVARSRAISTIAIQAERDFASVSPEAVARVYISASLLIVSRWTGDAPGYKEMAARARTYIEAVPLSDRADLLSRADLPLNREYEQMATSKSHPARLISELEILAETWRELRDGVDHFPANLTIPRAPLPPRMPTCFGI